MSDKKKIIIIVMDGVGAGEAPDAKKYGDVGSSTLTNLAEAVNGLKLPNLEKLGFGNVTPMRGIMRLENPLGCYGRLCEKSMGKDSTSGHWELAGLVLDFAFPTYPNGFPDYIIDKFTKAIGRGILGNKPASGTEIIKELGEEHLKTGKPIVYTSADSVFQIASHEDIIPIEEQYKICQIARDIMTGKDAVGRIIARPFAGKSGEFARTRRRRDFTLPPPGKTVLDILMENKIPTIGIGKIDDLFSGIGLLEKIHTESDLDGLEKTIEWSKKTNYGLIMTNLVDFDMLWGHRNDPKGFAKGLEHVDSKIPSIIDTMNKGDVLIFSADHGNDPTDVSTDHTREYVPLLCYGKGIKNGINLGIRESFADVGATISEFFEVPKTKFGKSFWNEIKVG
jgi:phosphopentomutase